MKEEKTIAFTDSELNSDNDLSYMWERTEGKRYPTKENPGCFMSIRGGESRGIFHF